MDFITKNCDQFNKKGMRGRRKKLQVEMMEAYRNNPPTHINNSPVLNVDYETQLGKKFEKRRNLKIE